MTARAALIDYVLAHGWDDDEPAALEPALAKPTDEASVLSGNFTDYSHMYFQLTVTD